MRGQGSPSPLSQHPSPDPGWVRSGCVVKVVCVLMRYITKRIFTTRCEVIMASSLCNINNEVSIIILLQGVIQWTSDMNSTQHRGCSKYRNTLHSSTI